MIDSASAVTPPAGASSATAKAAAAVPGDETSQPGNFAQLLAQSASPANATDAAGANATAADLEQKTAKAPHAATPDAATLGTGIDLSMLMPFLAKAPLPPCQPPPAADAAGSAAPAVAAAPPPLPLASTDSAMTVDTEIGRSNTLLPPASVKGAISVKREVSPARVMAATAAEYLVDKPALCGMAVADSVQQGLPAVAQVASDQAFGVGGKERRYAPSTAELTEALSAALGTSAHGLGTTWFSAAPINQANTLLVPTHIDAPGWSKDFGQHVIRLAVAGQPAAEIHLNPPELGPIRISIEMSGQDTTVSFAAANAHTRNALEQALPVLRDMFAANDLNLGGASVASQTFSQGSAPGHGFMPPAMPGRVMSLRAAEDDTPSTPVSRQASDRTRVDLFA